MMQPTELTGFLLINKPEGKTSFDCIRVLKRLLPKKTKIGHAGTLDDFATGLLIVGIGRQATRLLTALMGTHKSYVATAKLGEWTDSLDLNGKVLETVPVGTISRTDLQDALKKLMPTYQQIPPVYSALKHEGKPLYELARRNKMSMDKLEEISQSKARTVTIFQADICDVQLPFFTLSATVSKGTYVRSLADDVAQQLGLHAATYQLERTASGNLSLSQAVGLDQVTSIEAIQEHLKSIEEITALSCLT
jgi:tRNA pseudouridine55 synthase